MGKREPVGEKRRHPGRKLLILAVVVVIVAGFVWSQQTILCRQELTVTCPGLPAEFDGYRITLVSDLHGTEFGPDNVRLIRAVAASEPDCIAILGDLVDDPDQLAMVPATVKGLAAVAPCFYITGNHEWAANCVPELTEMLTDCGVTVLLNDWELLERDGAMIVLAGVQDNLDRTDGRTPELLIREIETERPGTYTALLAHRNTRLKRFAACGYDLVLSGHGHGGVIRLPVVGGLIDTDHTLNAHYEDGLYTRGETQMVVSRGLGNNPHTLRLFNLPQVLTVVLEAA